MSDDRQAADAVRGLDERLSAVERMLREKAPDTPSAKRTNWSIVVPIVVAAIGFSATVVATIVKWIADTELEVKKYETNEQLERRKLQSSIILQAIATGNAQDAAANLLKFQEWRLIALTDEQIAELKANPQSAPFTASASSSAPTRSEAASLIGFEMTEEWAAANIVEVEIPQLKGVPLLGSDTRFSGKVKFHKLGAQALKDAFAEVEAAGLRDRIKDWGGSFVFGRLLRGTQTPSAHAMGLAFDMNVLANPFGKKPSPEAEGSLEEIAPIFEKYGFVWGGRSRFPDASHFEYRALTGVGVEAAAGNQ